MASGTNSTVRQVGNALGIAVIGTVVTTLTINHAVRAVSRHAQILPPSVGRQAAAQIQALGANYRPPAGLASTAPSATLAASCATSVSTATHDAAAVRRRRRVHRGSAVVAHPLAACHPVAVDADTRAGRASSAAS